MNDAFTPSPSDDAAVETELSAVTTSERHRLLSAPRRRVVVRLFDDESLPMGLETLADAVVERESASRSRVDTATSVRVTLHHQHLPLLDDLGVVDYDAETRVVSAP